MSKKPGKTNNGGHVADQVAEFIGRTMGELLNKKDALSKQLVEVDRQIADVRTRVVRQFGDYLPAKSRPARKRKSTRSGGGGASRQVSPATRQKMADAARKRWARERAKKAKAAAKAR